MLALPLTYETHVHLEDGDIVVTQNDMHGESAIVLIPASQLENFVSALRSAKAEEAE